MPNGDDIAFTLSYRSVQTITSTQANSQTPWRCLAGEGAGSKSVCGGGEGRGRGRKGREWEGGPIKGKREGVRRTRVNLGIEGKVREGKEGKGAGVDKGKGRVKTKGGNT